MESKEREIISQRLERQIKQEVKGVRELNAIVTV